MKKLVIRSLVFGIVLQLAAALLLSTPTATAGEGMGNGGYVQGVQDGQ